MAHNHIDPFLSSPARGPILLDPALQPQQIVSSFRPQTPMNSQFVSQGDPYPPSKDSQMNSFVPLMQSSTPKEEDSDEEDVEEEQDDELDDDEQDQDQDSNEEDPVANADIKKFVDEQVRLCNLQPPSAHQLYKYAQLTQHKWAIILMATLLSVSEMVQQNDSSRISEDGQKQVKSHSLSILLSPTLTAYSGGPVFKPTYASELLKTMGTKLPNGWSQDLVKRKLIKKAIRAALTQAWSDIKKKLYGWDIAKLSSSLCGDDIIITVAHWARFAFLHWMVVLEDNKDFWPHIDDKLKQVHEDLVQKVSKDPKMLEQKVKLYFVKVLKPDFELFGNPAQRHVDVTDAGGLLQLQKRAGQEEESNRSRDGKGKEKVAE
ncbi:hypothetical protein M422DRAFT_269140 [Sphaerobolus stellatus SS14]|uniref:Uncharacterized protein n=1 Tax=Sphaerobolus stellatus (strain SS14) TaxID=990650 RepID=A0A0C9UL10_SPHS4|nr:hypothetical protein M422DRAFT_269140 [Sphaerobolus stellatus SS14]